MAMATLGQTPRGCATLPPVSSDSSRLRLEIVRGVNPITGRLSDSQGTLTTFAGWAQLIRAIEQAAHVQLGGSGPDDGSQNGANTTRRIS